MRTLAAILVLSSGSLLAQDYVVTTKRDTVRGKISVSSFPTMDRIIVTSPDKKKTDYNASALLSVNIDNTMYQPVRIPEAYRLMKVGRSGLINVCYARQSPGTPYDVPYLVKRTGQSMQITNIRFKRSVITFLNECPKLQLTIEQEQLGSGDLEKILDHYTECLDQNTTQVMESSEDPTQKALLKMSARFQADSMVPLDAKDILKDITLKVKEGKPVPNYLLEGLKSSLSGRADYAEDLEALVKLLKG